MVESVLALDLSVASPTCWTCFLFAKTIVGVGNDWISAVFEPFLTGNGKDQKKRLYRI